MTLSAMLLFLSCEAEEALILNNHTGFTMQAMYLSPHSDDYFDQPNFIGFGGMEDGDDLTIPLSTFTASEPYDFLFIDENNDRYYLRKVDPHREGSEQGFNLTLEHLLRPDEY
jgi:hypothetical protein